MGIKSVDREERNIQIKTVIIRDPHDRLNEKNMFKLNLLKGEEQAGNESDV